MSHMTRWRQAGEAFLMGKGAAEASGAASEWDAVCALLHAPVPDLDSQLLPRVLLRPPAAPVVHRPGSADSAAGGGLAASAPGAPGGSLSSGGADGSRLDQAGKGSAGAAGTAEEATRHLQRLLLEGIANGAASEPADIARLLSCTLAAHQVLAAHAIPYDWHFQGSISFRRLLPC